MLVSAVEPDSPADRAGIERGLVLYRIGNYNVNSVKQVDTLLKRANSGERVDFAVGIVREKRRAACRTRHACGALMQENLQQIALRVVCLKYCEMIKVENLTKRYAGQPAIQDLNFEVGKGEIMGFLGPNGAGKSTTMRILSSFMPPTSGRATVAGFDIFDQSLQARAHLGYMPENVPLYNDMRVTEYLNYRAALKSVPHRRIAERVGDVKELCGLKDVEKKLIGALSKGYRQRVGLADALVHEPDLLILDEPTSGLDPNQIRQVRDLIKNLGKQHTILLSTHILPEVEMTCSRVIIIHKGRIEACDTPENLLGQIRTAGGVRLEAKVGKDDGVEELKKIAGVRDVTASSDGDWKTFLTSRRIRRRCARRAFSSRDRSAMGCARVIATTRHARRRFRRDHAPGRSLGRNVMSNSEFTQSVILSVAKDPTNIPRPYSRGSSLHSG